MRMHIIRTIGGLLAAGAILIGTGTAGAQMCVGCLGSVDGQPPAWTTPAPDPAAPAQAAQAILATGLLGPTPAEWSPQGTVIAQTGFDPQVDGFDFLNYADHAMSLPNLANAIFFDVPVEDVVNLTADDMRSLFGREACTNRVGPCIPTLAAEATREAYNEAMDGGHCLGIAATAAQVFNKDLPLAAIGSGWRPPYRTPWSSTLTRTIARNFSWQYVNDADDYTLSPTAAVAELRTGLKPGSAPYVMAVYETPPAQGGHAITPIALLDRGNGLYDVAVWDNNFPGRVRAVHIDTTANGGKGSMEYKLFEVPGKPPAMASGDFGLIPAKELLGPQPCPFCDSAAGTSVTIDAVTIPKGGSVDVSVTGLDGKPIKGLDEFPAVDPPGDGMQTFPIWVVPADVSFEIVLKTRGISNTVVTSVTAQEGDGTWIASNLAIRPKSRDVVTVRPDRESIAFTSTTGTDPTLAIIDNADSADTDTAYQVEMRRIRLNAGRSAELDLDFAADEAILTTDQRQTRPINVAATLESGTTESTLYAWSEAPPRGFNLTVDFAAWATTAPTALDGCLTTPTGERRALTWRKRIASPQSAQTTGFSLTNSTGGNGKLPDPFPFF